jgi:hypothetical protein
MIEFIGPLYNLLQHFTNHHLRLDTLDFWPHYSFNRTVNQKLKSKSHCDWWSLSQLSLGVEPPDIYYCLTVTVLFLWGTLSDERTGLSFLHAAGPRQHSLSRVRVSSYSRPYLTVSDLRLHFSSPPTTRRVTAEVFDPASIRVNIWILAI